MMRMKMANSFFFKVKHALILPLSIYPRKIKAYVLMKTCMQMFVSTLIRTAKNWKQSKCPSTIVNRWTNCDVTIQWTPVQN